MLLSELFVEAHHEGKMLVVRTVTPPYRGSGMVTVVEDTAGNADKVGIYNQCDSSLLVSVPQGALLAIKEPYYKYSGDNDYMISIDHPSDVILLEADDPIVPKEWRGKDPNAGNSAIEWRQAGDKAFIERNLPEAIAW
jgi:hypothetical protein